jgi:hypothetical protein
MSFVIHNDHIIEKDSANISMYNKALFFDFAVYDSMKIVKGKAFSQNFMLIDY